MILTLLIFAFLVIAALAFTVRRQLQTIRWAEDDRRGMAEEINELRRHLHAVLTVIERSGGGVDKRIREHTEIVESIESRNPNLFIEDPGLRHWLNANNEFFKALRSASRN